MDDSMDSPDASADRTWGMLCHLSAFAAFVLPSFGQIIGPLVVWLIKKDSMPVVADQGKEALNFNITMTLAAIVSGALMLVLIGFVLLPLVFVAWLVLTIIAAVAANRGERYRYPFCLRLIA